MIKKFSDKQNKNIKLYNMKFSVEWTLNQWDIIPIQILKKANRNHPFYWKIVVDEKYFANLIRNFETSVRHDEIPINREHDRTEAQAWFKKLYSKWDELWADIEVTKQGAENLNGKHYKYFSAEISDKYQDPDTLQRFENVLVGGALTNYPYFNGMEKIVFSDPSDDTDPNNSLFINWKGNMLKDLLAKFSSKNSLDFSEKLELTKAFSEATEEEQKENQTAVENTLNKYADPEKEDMKQKLANYETEKKFSEVQKKFSDLHVFNQTEDEPKAEAEKVLKMFASLTAEEMDAVHKFFSDYQKVIETLTWSQISVAFAQKEQGKEKKMSKDGKKEKVSEAEFAKICEKHAKDKDIDFNKAYEAMKDQYEIEK